MIKKILRNIRQKPKAVREQYAFWIACLFTSVVAFIWVSTTLGLFDSATLSAETTATTTGSLSSFMEGTQEQIGSLQQQVQAILPAEQPNEIMVRDMETQATTSDQAAAAAPVRPTNTRQEIRIATTSATSTVD